MERLIDFEHQQFSVLEAAQHLRISRSFLYQLIGNGSLRPLKIGTRTLFTGRELARAVKAMTAPPRAKTKRAA
jgi:excisionase family DNA binding protein